MHQDSFTSGGQTISTISSSRVVDDTLPPPASDLAFRLQLILVVMGELLRLHAHAYTCSTRAFKHRVFVKQMHDSAIITCNTEKDKHRVKNQTAGMMDATTQNILCVCVYEYVFTFWKVTEQTYSEQTYSCNVGILVCCGTVALIVELFGTESKSQVHGTVHTFLPNNHESNSDLGMSITNDLLLLCVYQGDCLLYEYVYHRVPDLWWCMSLEVCI